MAPSGYKKLLEPIEIVVNAASGIYTITADKTEITTDIEKENGYKKVTVENKKEQHFQLQVEWEQHYL
mgnify:CR=1 FL=1